MTIVRTLRFRARLSRATHAALDSFLEDLRCLWNAGLEERIDAYRKRGLAISAYDQCKSLTRIRADDPRYAQVSVKAQRSILFRLDAAFKSFFARIKRGEKPGFPRFRSRRRAVRSFETEQFRVQRQGAWNSVTVKGIGRFRFKGEIDGKPKRLRIVRTARRVEVQIIVERELSVVAEDARAPVGIDVGIRSRVALSTGETVPGVKIDRTELKRRQRILSRSKRGSNARRKKRSALAREWQRVAERERGAAHELTAKLVRAQGSRFYIEDLQVRNMAKNHHLARAILEQQWSTVVTMLTYKAEEAGGWVRKVPPHGTSQRCSACGATPKEKLGLSVRTYVCAPCGYSEDRDVNAGRNILLVGLALDHPGGNSPGCRETADERGARSATAGASCYGTEQYQSNRRAA